MKIVAELLLTFIEGKFSTKMNLHLVLNYDGPYVQLTKINYFQGHLQRKQ